MDVYFKAVDGEEKIKRLQDYFENDSRVDTEKKNFLSSAENLDSVILKMRDLISKLENSKFEDEDVLEEIEGIQSEYQSKHGKPLDLEEVLTKEEYYASVAKSVEDLCYFQMTLKGEFSDNGLKDELSKIEDTQCISLYNLRTEPSDSMPLNVETIVHFAVEEEETDIFVKNNAWLFNKDNPHRILSLLVKKEMSVELDSVGVPSTEPPTFSPQYRSSHPQATPEETQRSSQHAKVTRV